MARALDVQASLQSIYQTLGDTPLIDLVVFDAAGDVVGIEPPDPYTLGRNISTRPARPRSSAPLGPP